MREYGSVIPEEVANNEIETEETKRRKFSELCDEAKKYILVNLAGRKLSNGNRIASLNSEGVIPTFEGRGTRYITHYGEGIDSLPLAELIQLPEGREAVQDFFSEKEIEDSDIQNKIMEYLNKFH